MSALQPYNGHEKADMHFNEDVVEKQPVAPNGLSLEDDAFLQSFPEDKKKKLLWKIDIRLVPMLLWLYLITYIDKVDRPSIRLAHQSLTI